MPSACEFKCDNKECKHYQSGFTMLAPWPIGEIDRVIEADNVKLDKKFQEELRNIKKAEGRKYACINYPNKNDIPKLGYRVQKWCDKCLMIWNYDAMIVNNEETVEETVSNAHIPETCIQCNGQLKTFVQVVEDGVDCPHCQKRLIPQVWFSNETTGDDDTRTAKMTKIKDA